VRARAARPGEALRVCAGSAGARTNDKAGRRAGDNDKTRSELHDNDGAWPARALIGAGRLKWPPARQIGLGCGWPEVGGVLTGHAAE
jgi:hypothetical protein